jgi:hypothetical protein
LKRNNRRKLGIHELRHGRDGILLEAGHPLDEITDQLGHSFI